MGYEKWEMGKWGPWEEGTLPANCWCFVTAVINEHNMYTPLSSITLTCHLCTAVSFPHFLISHFPFSVPTLRVTPTSCRDHWCTHYPSLVPRLLHPQAPCSQPITIWRQALSTLYSAVGHGWNTQFTRPFPSRAEVVGLARLIGSAMKLHSNNKLTVIATYSG